MLYRTCAFFLLYTHTPAPNTTTLPHYRTTQTMFMKLDKFEAQVDEMNARLTVEALADAEVCDLDIEHQL